MVLLTPLVPLGLTALCIEAGRGPGGGARRGPALYYHSFTRARHDSALCTADLFCVAKEEELHRGVDVLRHLVAPHAVEETFPLIAGDFPIVVRVRAGHELSGMVSGHVIAPARCKSPFELVELHLAVLVEITMLPQAPKCHFHRIFVSVCEELFRLQLELLLHTQFSAQIQTLTVDLVVGLIAESHPLIRRDCTILPNTE